ncbi:unnamed protein product [Mesocestoides corti]|uniref:Uncharacterized protein n=1 Tax=Mesocestoides corti TaxID=53468 RepID=A0A0R3UB41_MESCO|nr:unnamed protein product [Mesocestoides corti]
MRAFLAAVFALLAVIVLTTSAEESKGHEEDKRMLYWKRDSPFDSEEEDKPAAQGWVRTPDLSMLAQVLSSCAEVSGPMTIDFSQTTFL